LCSSPPTELYNPKVFITHAALLRQAFAHCGKFLTAASRRSLGRVSVPVWLIVLSDQLPIIALVGRYPTNKLIGREPVIERLHDRGSAVAVCTAFRHVREPLEHRRRGGAPSLRELVRRTNLEAARLSRRTGCFVLDLDRPLAQEGGASLGADCFGGEGRAAEIALEELVALILDALPDDVVPAEGT